MESSVQCLRRFAETFRRQGREEDAQSLELAADALETQLADKFRPEGTERGEPFLEAGPYWGLTEGSDE